MGLQKRKKGKNKINILRLFIEKLKHKPFKDIYVEDICDEVEISKMTFFNYFPKKAYA